MASRDELANDTADTPGVHGDAVGFAADQELGGAVAQGTSCARMAAFGALHGEEDRHAEVCDFEHGVASREEHVGRLEVSVHN